MDNGHKFLILGHPRCGTKYMSQIMHSFGFQVGHEKMETDGTANWVYVIPDQTCFEWIDRPRRDFHFECLIHCLRDPFKAIPSIAFTENYYPEQMLLDPWSKQFRRESTEFRRYWVRQLLGWGAWPAEELNEIDEAVCSFLGWNRLIEMKRPDLVVRIEAINDDLLEGKAFWPYLEGIGIGFEEARIAIQGVSRSSNSRSHPSLTDDDWSSVRPELLTKLDVFCRKYGYLPRFSRFIRKFN